MRYARMRNLLSALAAVALVVAAGLASGQGSGSEKPAAARVERGRYLVENVAMCGFCHSPKDADGKIVAIRPFTGAPIPVEAPAGWREWAIVAPGTMGFIGYTDREAIRLLSEGYKRDGTRPKPPMPPYRMTEEDALAVVAYLRSLR